MPLTKYFEMGEIDFGWVLGILLLLLYFCILNFEHITYTLTP